MLNKKAFSINDSENYREMSTNDYSGTRGTSRLNIGDFFLYNNLSHLDKSLYLHYTY